MTDRFNFAHDVVDAWAQRRQGPALILADPATGATRTFDFADVRRHSRAVAAQLAGLGVNRGDAVAVVLPRVAQWWFVMTALHRLGAVAVPGTPLLTAKDLHYRINAASIRAVVAEADTADRVDEIAADCPSLRAKLIVGSERPGWNRCDDAHQHGDDVEVDTLATDPALLYFTSGTTGHPKMVLHTQASYGRAHRLTGEWWLGLKPTDIHWNLSDTGWAKAAWSSLYGPWHCGSAVFAVDARGKFDPAQVLDVLERFPITSFCAAPTAYRLLVRENLAGRTFSHLRSCVSAGEPLNPEVIDTWSRATGLVIREGYGQSESVVMIGVPPGMTVEPGDMGVQVPGFEMAIVDDAGVRQPAGTEGDIAVRVRPDRPEGLFVEYANNPDENAARFRGDWYFTGDRGTANAAGVFRFVGRADDVIKSSGYRIGPFEVESALIEHPAVLEAAVVGVPDDLRGQLVKAFVVLRPGRTAGDELVQELQEHVRKTTAPYKYPRLIEFVSELPKTISGKIRRNLLRNQ